MVPIRGGQLDSSSDAIGYVRGHWARLNDQWTAECLLQCYQPGLDYFSELKAHRDWVVELFDQLLHASPQVIEDQALRERRRRQDWAQRLAYLAPHFPSADEAEVVSYFAAFGDHSVPLASVIEALDDHLARVLNREQFRGAFLADGVDAQHQHQVSEGLHSAYPETSDGYPELFEPAQINAFTSAPEFHTSGSLASRFYKWSKGTLTADQSAWMHLELAIRDQQHPDLLCDACAGEVDVQRLAEGEWRWNSSIVEVEVTPLVAQDVFELAVAQPLTALCAIFCGEAMVLPLDDELLEVWRHKTELPLNPQMLPVIAPFLELGMLWWFAPAR